MSTLCQQFFMTFSAIFAAIVVLLPNIGHSEPVSYTVPTMPLEMQASFDNVPQKTGALKVAYLPPATEFNFYLDAWKGITVIASAAGYETFLLAPQKDHPAEQMKMLQSLLQQDVAAIILSTHDERAAAPFIEQAVQKGMIVVIINTDNVKYPAPVHAIVGYAQRKWTYHLAQYALSLAQGKTMSVGILEGEPGYHSTERIGGFEDALTDAGLRVAARLNGHWEAEGGYAATLQMLQEHPEIGIVFAGNDFEIIGAAAALETLKRSDVMLFGYDGMPDAISRIATGKITGTVLLDAYRLGQVAMQVVIDSLQGRFRGGFVENQSVLITQANAKEYLTAPALEALTASLKEMFVVSEPLPGLTNEDGTGLYWDILRAVYEPMGITVKIQAVPLKRAQVMIENKTADVMLGHYRGDSEDFIFPQWHYSAQTISALFKKGSLNWNGQPSLAGKRIAWIRGADYGKYLSVPVVAEEKNDHLSPLLMVNADRLDAFLDDRAELLKTFRVSADRLKHEGFDRENCQIEDVLELKLYPAFADTPQGRKLAEIFDDRMPQLLSSGKLKVLFEQWNFGAFPF